MKTNILIIEVQLKRIIIIVEQWLWFQKNIKEKLQKKRKWPHCEEDRKEKRGNQTV